MDTLPDLVARERRSDALALRVSGSRRQGYTYHRFCTTAWKTGNFLRHLGVRGGARVAIADDHAAQPVLALFGTVLLGGVVQFDPLRSVDARALVAPASQVEDYALPTGGQRAGYGGEPTEPATHHFEEGVWSENPSTVPREYDPDAPVLTDGEREYSHRTLLEAADETVDRHGVGEGDEIAVRESLADPGVVAAGILAPLLAGATIVLDEVRTAADPALIVDRGAEENAVVVPDL